MRIVTCGSRDYVDRVAVDAALSPYLVEPLLIANGADSGADNLVARWCSLNRVGIAQFAADWRTDGNAADWIRNQRMLDAVEPHLVIVFPGGDTADMVERARRAGVEVVLEMDDEEEGT